MLVPIALDQPASPPPGVGAAPRPLLATTILISLIAVIFLVAQVAAWSLDRHWPWPGPQVVDAVTFVLSSWSLYADPVLFSLWQLWTSALIQYSWWLVACDLLLIGVVGGALERHIGTAAYAGAVLTLMPMAAVSHLICDDLGTVTVGATGLVLGLMGMAMMVFPRGQVRWAVVYYAIIAVGFIPLFRMPLSWLTLGYAVVVLLVQGRDAAGLAPTVAGFTICLAAGMLLGAASRRLHQRS